MGFDYSLLPLFAFCFCIGLTVVIVIIGGVSLVTNNSEKINFCVGEFGHDTLHEHKDGSNFCVKVLDNGQVAEREIVFIDGEWRLKDGLLEPQKLLNRKGE